MPFFLFSLLLETEPLVAFGNGLWLNSPEEALVPKSRHCLLR